MADQTSADEITKDSIAKKLVEKADGEFMDFRKVYTKKWTDIYYSYIGQDKPDEEVKEDWRSKVNPKVMKVKVLAAWSQMVQALMGNKELIDVSPNEAGDGAAEAAKGMKQEILEQWDRGDFTEKLKIGALDKVLYGNCHFQAPVVVARTKKQWVLDKMATLQTVLAMRPQKVFKTLSKQTQEPTVFNRNVFEMYPYPYATSTQDGEGIFHRPFISEYELVELSKKEGFDKDAIREILKAGAAEQNYDDGMETKQQARGYTSGNRKGYDLLYYCGKYDAKDLSEAAIAEFKEMRGFVEIMAWIVNASSGPRAIKLTPNPLTEQKRPFYSSVYERVPHEIMGVGVGENSLDFVELIKGGVRLYIDSKKMALPMLAVDPSKRAAGSTLELRPFKIFQFNGKPEDFIKQFQFKDVSDGLITLIELAERFADEVTGIPKWTTGGNQKDYTKTATGLGMLMNAQGQLMRGAIENFDDFIIEPIGEAFYDWNMEHNPNSNIKGDFKVRANGLSSMMAKEVLNQQLMQMISFVINPVVMQNPAAVRILRIIGANAQIPNVDEILPSPDEMRKFADMTMAQAQGRIAGISAPDDMAAPVIGPEASGSPMSAAGTGAMA